MAIYEEVPLNELQSALLTYAPCWGTVVFGGMVIKEEGKFIPCGLQIWSRDEANDYHNTLFLI